MLASSPDPIWHLRQALRARVTWIIVAIVLLIHVFVEISGGVAGRPEWYLALGLDWIGLPDQPWCLLSYALLHAHRWHVLANVAVLGWMGARIETVVGPGVMLRTLVAGVALGGVGHLGLGHDLLVGISGGAMALIMLWVTLSPDSRMVPIPVSGKSLGIGLMLAAACLTVIDPSSGLPCLRLWGKSLDAHGLAACFGVSHACHLGGGLAGWLYARWLLRPRVTLAQLQRDRARREKDR